MRKSLLLVSAMSLCLSVQAYANDDVYVDLSVLDTISQDSIGFVASQPLFPTVKAQPKAKAKIRASKARKVKSHRVAKPTVRPKPAKKIVIPHKEEPVLVEKTVAKPTPIQAVDNISSLQPTPSVENEVHKPILLNDENTRKDSTEDTITPVEPSVSELSVKVDNQSPDTETQTLDVPNEGVDNKDEIQPQTEATAPQVPVNNQEEANSQNENASAPVSLLPNVTQQSVQPTEPSPVEVSQVNDVIVIDHNPQPISEPKELYVLHFDDGDYEINNQNIKVLNDAIAKFDSQHKSKILIKAYNYDNGQDSFRKKRLSLNRATEVRSYFLSHGFKDFSIKIVNTTIDDEYRNTVEIEENK